MCFKIIKAIIIEWDQTHHIIKVAYWDNNDLSSNKPTNYSTTKRKILINSILNQPVKMSDR